MVCLQALLTWCTIEEDVPLPMVPFDLCHAPPIPTLVRRLMSLMTQVQLRAVSGCSMASLPLKGW